MKKWNVTVFVGPEKEVSKYQRACVIFTSPEKMGSGFGPYEPKACVMNLDTVHGALQPGVEYAGEIRDDFGVDGIIEIDGRIWPCAGLYPQFQEFEEDSPQANVIEAAVKLVSKKIGFKEFKAAVRAL